MRPPRLLPVTFALLIASAACAAAASSQPDPAKSAPQTVDLAKIPMIEFYLAKGEADACGPGCNTWIVAEGQIDAGAAPRLRRLLGKLGRPRLPIYFHSPGGLLEGSLELGRLIREQKLEVGVAHTVVLGCDRDKPDKSCQVRKRAGEAIEARIDQIAMCNSSCVYALAGGSVRHVAPWVKLGIHDVGFDPSKAPPRALAGQARTQAHEHIREFLREMGIDDALFRAASAIPFESKRFLERDEMARFGIDRREFGETGWQLVDKPGPAMVKRYFAHTDNDRVRYLDGLVTLSCLGGQVSGVGLVRQHAGAVLSGSSPVSIDLNGQRIDLRNQSSSQDFDFYSASLSGSALDASGEAATMALSAADLARNDAAAVGVTLDMHGFSAAYAKLRVSCETQAREATNAWLSDQRAAGLAAKPAPSGGLYSLGTPPSARAPLSPPPPQPAPPPQASATAAVAPTQSEPVRQGCNAPIVDTPAHLTGRVTRFVSADEAASRIRRVEADLGAQISPSFVSLNRVVVEKYPQGDGWSTMAVVPQDMAVKIGDLVELNGRYRDQSLPCHFVPWTINRVVDHVE